MNKMLTVFAMLLGATVFFLSAMNFMADNIEDFESLPLPPKKVETLQSKNPTIKVDATSKDRWTLVDFSKRKTIFWGGRSLFFWRQRTQKHRGGVGGQQLPVAGVVGYCFVHAR